jgi:hypothetical protein
MSNIVVSTQDKTLKSDTMNTREGKLVSWIVSTVQPWIDHRDDNYRDKWSEYYRLFRGIFKTEDKTRNSERSTLINPALQQAIESAVAELEEATFGKGRWFDVKDNLEDQQKEDMMHIRKLLEEDLEMAGVKSAMSEVFLNGALYGTGIGKIVVEEVPEKSVQSDDLGGGVQQAGATVVEKVQVKLVSVEPKEFAIDPTARTIDEALGCAHIMTVPKHSVIQKQQAGIYKEGNIGSISDDDDFEDKGESRPSKIDDKTQILEYHGLVPKELLEGYNKEEFVELFDDEKTYEQDDIEFVEVIVTIANGQTLLKEVENPYIMQDRCFIAYQHDTIPNRFWGRGVAEKGYNPQKALDAELRARIDAMALTIHPMMGVDATRIPRGADFRIKPGRTVLTNGDPSTILKPFTFGQVSSDTFHQSGELERMIQMATGSMDSAAPVGVSPRNSTASGMSMMLAGSIKRNKRTLANIEEHFTSKLIHKAAWRYMQLDSDRYPIMDVKFRVYSTLGIMARELEQQQLSQLLNTVPPDSPAYWMLIRSIYDNSSITNKEVMLQLVEQLLQQSMNPQPSQMEQAQMQQMQQQAQERMASLSIEKSRADTERARVIIEAEKVLDDKVKKTSETILNLAKAESEEAGVQLQAYQATVDAMKAKSAGALNEATGETRA